MTRVQGFGHMGVKVQPLGELLNASGFCPLSVVSIIEFKGRRP
jgi:hypothetical protein